ncbi:DNA polymerase I [Anaerorhabdus sp.]|uniref:DNA polymerase I n=1 Tax=Anaerorhabdus sp. TaxID=1872524 RepID=UPI002FC951FA
MKKLLLVDGNSMLFRAFYATIYGRPMTTSTGLPTNAVYGFASMFQKALELVQPEAVLVAFDSGKHTFRHDIFEDYKGGRKETPEELVVQFGLVRDYLDAYHVKRCELTSIEADDIIGTMSKKYPDWDINILSSDRDLLQLIDDTTSVWLMKKGITEIEENTVESLKESLGIAPQQIIDLKGLMGDASDNIPGIPGVGEKTALKLLSEYETVENLLNHIDDLKGKLKERVETFQNQARLSKQLATIKTDVELPITVDDCLYTPDYASLVKFFESVEMNSMIKKFESLIDSSDEVIVEDKKEFNQQEVKEVPQEFLVDDVVLILDTNCDQPNLAEVAGFVVMKEEHGVYISLTDARKDEHFVNWLKSAKRKITFDSKLMYHCMKRIGLEINGIYFDTMIAVFLCDSTLTNWQRIKTNYNFNEEFTTEDVYGTFMKPKLPDGNQQIRHACQFANYVMQMYISSKPLIEEYEMQELFYEIEMPLSKVLFEMEVEGILIDEVVLDEISKDTYRQIERLTQTIYEHAGEEFNLNSPKQLAEVLFDHLALPANKKRSTSIEVLEKLQGIHPIIDDLMEYRKVQKIYSTYAEGLKKYIQADHRIHTIYNQCATQTGRLSSSDPNLQNISVRDEQARIVRKAFIPTKDNVLIASDYSQVELRMLAHMADEKGLIDAFNTNLDIHTKTAMDVFGVDKDQVDSHMRRQAKAVNFGIVYGISDFGLSQQLGISRKEAQHFIDTYFEKYPGIHGYMNSVIEQCKEKGYVTTLLNRRREIKEIHDKNHMVREFGKRAAMNAPIQGSAADLIKIAMIHIQNEIKLKNLKSKMILQVHDELIFDVTQDEIEIMKELIQNGMEHAMELKVPLEAECKVGSTWYEAK